MNDAINQYHQVDISAQPPQPTINTMMLTKQEADIKNRALLMNGSTLKYILKSQAS